MAGRRGAGGRGEPMGRHANLLDPRPIYHWPVINQVSLATRGGIASTQADAPNYPPLAEPSKAPAAKIIPEQAQRQRFDRKLTMSADTFYRMLDCLLVRPIAPWDVWTYSPRLHLIFFIHRVEGLEPGLYALPATRRPHMPCKVPFGQISSGRGSMMPSSSSLRPNYAADCRTGRQAGELPSSDRE